MVKYQCQICKRQFSFRGGLIQHANAKHQGRMTLIQQNETVQHDERLWSTPITMPTSSTSSSQEKSTSQQRSLLQPEHDERLWSTPITMLTSSTLSSQEKSVGIEDILYNEPTTQDLEEVITSDLKSKPSYNLRKRARSENIKERVEENFEESEIESQLPVNLKDTDIDSEDLQEASLDDALDAIEGKNAPEFVAKWPSDAYHDFMKLIVDGNISNKIGDKIIKFFN
jgi:hypothetical protein